MPEKGGENSEALLDELRQLRKGVGFNYSKLSKCTHLLRLLGTGDMDAAVAAFASTVDSLGKQDPARALRAALGMDRTITGKTLTERRNTFALLNDKHPDTVESWENRMLEELVARLLSSNGAAVHLAVMASHYEQRFYKVSVYGVDPEFGDILRTYDHRISEGLMPTCLIYRPTITAASLLLTVRFEHEPYPRVAVYSMGTDLLQTTMLTAAIGDLDVEHDGDNIVLRFDVGVPDPDYYYAVVWWY